MNGTFTVWVPVVAFAVLTTVAIIHSRDESEGKKLAEENSHDSRLRKQPVSTATEFRVVDGDSVKFTFGADIPVSIRLVGIDAPELGQHYGFEAKENLERQLAGKQPEIIFEENDKYGRKVCTLLIQGRNLNLQLVADGFAWASPHASAIYHDAQNTAMRRGVGLWSRVNPIPPWEWRKKK